MMHRICDPSCRSVSSRFASSVQFVLNFMHSRQNCNIIPSNVMNVILGKTALESCISRRSSSLCSPPSSLVTRELSQFVDCRFGSWSGQVWGGNCPPSEAGSSWHLAGLRWHRAASMRSESENSSVSTFVPNDIIQFWFRDVDLEKNQVPKDVWFGGGNEFDREVSSRFGPCLQQAIRGELDHWKNSLRGRLALVIVLDQFSRNIFRGTPSAFAQDETAVRITLDSIDQGLDKQVGPFERMFFYMPLMHSENLALHSTADGVYLQLANEYQQNEFVHQELMGTLQFERKHSAVLKQFGRYPSRNSILLRKSTLEEEEYLSTGASW